MATASPLAPRTLKGAFIRLDETGIGAVPQIIVFQYNPENLTRKFKPYEPPADKEGAQVDATARVAPYDPDEEMDVVISLDAIDDLEEPEIHPQAVVAGVSDRLAALEMLMYPSTETGLLSSAVNAIAGALGMGGGEAVPVNPEVPVVLFAWGPGRVVPVKITAFTIEEQAFNSALYPIRAKVTVGIKVLTEDYFNAKKRTGGTTLTPAEELACSAYRYTKKQKEILAAANVANSVESVLSTLPF
jgi:hypothetical protein